MPNSNLPPLSANIARKFYSNNTKRVENNISFSSQSQPESENEDLSVYGITSDKSATGYYRIKYPLMYLAHTGAKTRVEYVPGLENLNFRRVLQFKTVIVSRCVDLPMFEALAAVCRRNDITLIYDIDDYVHDVHVKSPAYEFYNPNTDFGRNNLKSSEECMKLADSVIFSTHELRDQYQQFSRDSHIISNGIDLGLSTRNWNRPPSDEWKIFASQQGCAVDEHSVLFGWSGGITHLADLELIGDVVARVLDEVPDAFFGIYCDATLAAHVTIRSWKIPQRKVVFIPLQNFDMYPKYLGYFDVGLAPLENTLFNQCKSALRLMELNAMGVPYVASNVAPYANYHMETLGGGGHLAIDEKDFANAVKFLLTNPETRILKGLTAHEIVQEQFHVAETCKILPYTIRVAGSNRRSIIKMPSAAEILDSAKR